MYGRKPKSEWDIEAEEIMRQLEEEGDGGFSNDEFNNDLGDDFGFEMEPIE